MCMFKCVRTYTRVCAHEHVHICMYVYVWVVLTVWN